MIRDPLKDWVKSELERIEREEERKRRRVLLIKERDEKIRIMMERYLNAPVMNLQGEIVGRKSLSTGEKDQP